MTLVMGGGSAVTLVLPVAGAATLKGNAPAFAAVPVYKGNASIGVALANAAGAWTLALGAAVAAGDLYRTPGGGAVAVAAIAIAGAPGDATVGTFYAWTPDVSGGSGARSFTLAGSLLAGLSFNSSTGAISGKPVEAGAVSGLSITVTDATGSATLDGLSFAVVGGAAVATRILAVYFGQSNGEYVFLRGGPPQVAAITLAQELRTLAGITRTAPFAAYDSAKYVHDGSSQFASDWTVRIENAASGGSALVDTNGGGAQIPVVNSFGKIGNYWHNSPGRDNSGVTGDQLDNNSAGATHSLGPLARLMRDRVQALVASGLSLTHVIWSQGGSDLDGFATAPARAATYLDVNRQFFTNVRTWANNPALPIFVSMHHRHQVAGEADSEVMRSIHRSLVATMTAVYAGNEEYPQRNAIGRKLTPVANITAGSNVITTTDTGGITVNQRVVGPGIAPGAFASAVSVNASITLARMVNGVAVPAPATASATGAVIYQGDAAHLYPGGEAVEPYDNAGGTGYDLYQGYHLMMRQQARRVAQVLQLPNAPAKAQGPFVSGGTYTRGGNKVRVGITHVAGTDFAPGLVFDTAGWRIETGGVPFTVTKSEKVSPVLIDLTVDRPLYPATDAADLTVQAAYGAMNRTIETQFLIDNAAPVPFPLQSRGPAAVAVVEPEYAVRTQGILTAMQAAGSLPGLNRRAQVDALVRAFDGAGLWAYLDRYGVMQAHEQGAALINWANPGGPAMTLTGAATFTADRGFTDAGNTGAIKLDPGLNPTAGGTLLTRDNALASLFVTNAGSYSSPDITDTGNRFTMRARPGTVAQFKINGDSTTGTVTGFTDNAAAPFKVTGVRRDAAAQIGYRNGAPIVTGNVASAGLAQALTLTLSNRVIGMIALGAALPDDAAVLAMYQAELAYARAVGAVA